MLVHIMIGRRITIQRLAAIFDDPFDISPAQCDITCEYGIRASARQLEKKASGACIGIEVTHNREVAPSDGEVARQRLYTEKARFLLLPGVRGAVREE